MRIEQLDAAIKAVCPVDGVASTGRIDFRKEATPEQRAAAQSLMDEHLPTLDLSPAPPAPLDVDALLADPANVQKLKHVLGIS